MSRQATIARFPLAVTNRSDARWAKSLVKFASYLSHRADALIMATLADRMLGPCYWRSVLRVHCWPAPLDYSSVGGGLFDLPTI